jgi:hypothetical protein
LRGKNLRKETSTMRAKLTLLGGLFAAAFLMPSPASAIGPSPLAGPAADSRTQLQLVQFWDIGRCRAWRRECAERWGWGSGRWHRCLARHGCDRWRYGDRWDR